MGLLHVVLCIMCIAVFAVFSLELQKVVTVLA